MEQFNLNSLPSNFRRVLFFFVLVVSVGYGFGLRQLYISVGATPTNLEEHYVGNEADEDAEIMKFKKNEKELLTFLHNHLLSLGVLLLLLTLLLYFADVNKKLKAFLTVEPFVSLIITFTSIYGLWNGLLWLKYITIISGVLFHISFAGILVILIYQLGRRVGQSGEV
jgi:hypothetical protein